MEFVLKLFGRSAAREGGRLQHDWVAAARIALATAAGVATSAGAVLAGAAWAVSVTLGWSAAAAVLLILVWPAILAKDAVQTAHLAQSEDLSRATADAVLLNASVASLVAVGFLLIDAGNRSGSTKGLLIALGIVTHRTTTTSPTCP